MAGASGEQPAIGGERGGAGGAGGQGGRGGREGGGALRAACPGQSDLLAELSGEYIIIV